MSNHYQSRVRAGAAAGQYAAMTRRVSPVTLGMGRYPHPDITARHPMERWPQELETPESMEVTLVDDESGTLPLVRMTMANGA